MRKVRLIDVAPTMARVLGLEMPPVDGRPIEEVEGWGCQGVVLLIVDSLGYKLYRTLEKSLPHMRSLAEDGLMLKAKSVAASTTPAIASILTGLLPQNHGVYRTKDASESEIRSLLEWASSVNIKSAVVMEEEGANAFRGFVEVVKGVPRNLSASKFDHQIRKRSLEALSEAPRPKMLVAHFIGIDWVLHRGGGMDAVKEAAESIDDHVGAIVRASPPGTLVMVCGDHPAHAGQLKDDLDDHVALIIGKHE